jgi:hypothetical protein
MGRAVCGGCARIKHDPADWWMKIHPGSTSSICTPEFLARLTQCAVLVVVFPHGGIGGIASRFTYAMNKFVLLDKVTFVKSSTLYSAHP